jgi:hypothetical protein
LFLGTYARVGPFVTQRQTEADMGSGKAGLLWLIGAPLPIILILMLVFHH